MKHDIPLEKTITNDIVKWLKVSGYPFVIKIHGAAFQSAGLPDIITITRNGRFVGLEVKRPGVGKLTKLQEATLNRINQGGGFGVVVCSVEDAMAALRIANKGEDVQEATPVPDSML